MGFTRKFSVSYFCSFLFQQDRDFIFLSWVSSPSGDMGGGVYERIYYLLVLFLYVARGSQGLANFVCLTMRPWPDD